MNRNLQKIVGLTFFLAGLSVLWFLNDRSSIVFLLFAYTFAFLGLVLIWISSYAQRFELYLLIPALAMLSLLSPVYLSDDLYRYLWDGHLIGKGISPFAFVPNELPEVLNDEFFSWLWDRMGRKDTYSIYPALSQILFFIAGLGGKTWSVFFLKILALGFYLWFGWLLTKLDNAFLLSKGSFALLFFHPLLWTELVQEAHSEVFMLPFLLLFFYNSQNKKFVSSGLYLGLAALVKLWPLMLLAVLPIAMGWKKAFLSGLVALTVTCLGMLPFFWGIPFSGFLESFRLYFQNFEFNASIYYLIREIGFQLYGYNIIQSIGPSLAMVVPFLAVVLLVMAWQKNHWDNFALFLTSCFFLSLSYNLTATIVHPWYIIPTYVLGILVGYWRTVLVWSFTVFFSYHAYAHPEVKEMTWMLMLEYVPVYTILTFELYRYGISKEHLLAS